LGNPDLLHLSPNIPPLRPLQAVTCNKGLREQIDNLRRERMMFEAINAALDKDLSRIKRAMADTIAAANDAHAAKERAQAETANLKLQVG
jgi:hypothetical protein